MSPSSPYNTVTVGSGCAVGKGRDWLIPVSSLIMEIVARQSWYCVQSTMEGGGSWSWWMEPWTGIGTSRSWGIKCCHGRRGCLDVPRPIQHVTRQPFRTNRMLRSWTSQVRVQTWTQLSMFGIKCHSGSESMMTHSPPPSTTAELNNAVLQARATVRPRRVQTLFECMPRRVKALLAARGGHTRY